MSNPTKTKHGQPCKRCGSTLRYTGDRTCVNCKNTWHKRQTPEKQDQLNAKSLERYYQNREARLNQQKAYYQNNPDAQTARGRRYREKHRDSERRKAKTRRARKKQATLEPWTDDQLKRLFNYFANSCVYCGVSGSNEPLTLDHFVSLDRGGAHALYNIVPSCLSCNSSKGNKDAHQWAKSRDIPEDHIYWIQEIIGGFNNG